jgi:hypothetical protein
VTTKGRNKSFFSKTERGEVSTSKRNSEEVLQMYKITQNKNEACKSTGTHIYVCVYYIYMAEARLAQLV